MRYASIVATSMMAALLCACETSIDTPEESVLPANEVMVEKQAWSVSTKAMDFGPNEWNLGDEVTIISKDGAYPFFVQAKDGGKAILHSNGYKLKPGNVYRVVYPKPDRVDGMFRQFLTFGTYSQEDGYSPSVYPKDWLASPWTEYHPGKDFSFKLEKINAWVNIEFVAPKDMDVAKARIACSNDVFHIKGNFFFDGEKVEPQTDPNNATEREFITDVPLSEEFHNLKQGQKYTARISLFATDYSKSKFSFHLFSTEGEEYYSKIDLSDIEGGKVLIRNIKELQKYEEAFAPEDFSYKISWDEDTMTASLDITLDDSGKFEDYFITVSNYGDKRIDDYYCPLYIMQMKVEGMYDFLGDWHVAITQRKNPEGKYHIESSAEDLTESMLTSPNFKQLHKQWITDNLRHVHIYDTPQSLTYLDGPGNFYTHFTLY